MRRKKIRHGILAAKSITAAGLALLLLSPVEAAFGGTTPKIPGVVRQAVEQASAPPPVETRIEAVSPGPSVVGPLGGKEIQLVQMDADGNILLDLHSASPITNVEISDIEALGATVVSSTKDMKAPPGYNVIQAWVPSSQLDALEALAWVVAVRPVAKIPPDTGTFDSEGVTLHSADLVQAAGFDGAGFTVGVISDGVANLADAVATGDLPAGINVLDAGSDDEGTAMLEIIHDMAPGAGLAFHATGSGTLDHISAQNDLVAAGIDILTEDWPFDDEPAFQQGAVALNGDTIAANGVSVHSSAGNRGDQHAARVPATGTGSPPEGHTGTFSGCTTNPTNVVDIDPGPGNSFDVVLFGDFSITLQWSEPRSIFPTAGAGGFTNLDLYVVEVDGSGNTTCLLESVDPQGPAGSGDTIEQIGGTGAGLAKIVVNVASTGEAFATPTIDLRWRGRINSQDTPTREGSLNPDANYIGLATSAAAADAGDSTDPATVALEDFSSGGPVDLFLTTVCTADTYPCAGSAIAGSQEPGTPRNAPDWTGADGVDISGAGGFGSGTCPAVSPGDCEFFGTSASAPHAAACDALVRHAAGTPLTVAEVNTRLASTAFDRGVVGPDTSWGAGVLNCAVAAGIADLRFPAKSDSPDPVVAGTDLTYSLAINNAGPAPAVDVTITDTTPLGTTFVSATPSPGGSCTTPVVGGTGLVSCTWAGETPVVPDANSVREVTLVVHVPASTPDAMMISNTAEVTSSSPDPDLTNNSASADTTVITRADLSITKTDDPDPVLVFGTLTYTLEVANGGPSDAQNVLVTDTLPLGVTLVATSGCAEDPNGAPTCTLGTIAAGSSAQYTIEVTVDAPLASLTLTNNAEVASATADPDLTNNTDSSQTTADDGDGADPAVEAQVPGVNGSAQGDGDGNGIQDNLEPWTASVPSVVGDCWFTVTNAQLDPLEDVRAEPPHPNPAIGAAFPCGMVSYEVVLPGVGAGVDVRLWMYPPRAGYVALGKSGPFGTVRMVDSVPDNVDVKAVFGFRGADGKDLDEDYTADGIFSDPIGPIRGQEFPTDMVHPSRPVPTLLPLGLGLLGLLLAGVAYRARRRR